MFKNKNKIKYYVAYTILFALICVIAFNYFYLTGKTFISNGDGIDQYYKALIYYGRYLRDIISNKVIPEFDFHMGEGGDILSALYYTIGDPIASLVVFVPEEYVYLFYDLSIILRIYLAGIIFSELCFYVDKGSNYAKLAGCFAYIFSYWVILSQSKDIYFLNPTIYFPLVILGVEKLLKGDKPYTLILGVFLSGISNFYFLFMIAILTVFYVVIRLLLLYRLDYKKIINKLIQIALASIEGVLLSAVTVFPVAYALLSNNRLGVNYGLHPFYPIFYYQRLLTIFLSNDDPYWLCMGFASPCLLSTALAFKQYKKDKLLFFLNLLCLIMIVLPIFGKILNGFSYVSNRWSFAIALLVAYTLTSKWEEFNDNKIYLSIAMFLIFAWAAIFAWSRDIRVLIPIMIALFFLIVLLLDINKKIIKIDLKNALLLGLVIFSILYTADYVYSYRGRNRTRIVLDKETARNILVNNEADFVKESVSDKDFYRYSGNCLTNNIAILENTHTTSYYFSIANPNISNYRNKLAINEYLNFFYKEYDQRTSLLSLANVKYYVNGKDDKHLIPYGFTKIKENNEYELYQNSYALPFGYTYESSVDYKWWDSLNPVEKQEVLTKAVVVEDANSVIPIMSKSLNFTVDNMKENYIFDIKEDNKIAKIKFNAEKQGEYYLVFDGVEFDDGESYYNDSLTDMHIRVRINGLEKNVEYHTNDYQFYNGKNSFAIYLGVLDQSSQEIELEFKQEGIVTVNKIEICYMPLEVYDGINLLGEEHLNNVEFSNNRFTGSINLKEDKYLLLSIPYSNGWKAYVDGEKVDILKANEAYMALKLSSGQHNIEFIYATPFKNIGLITSVISFVGLFVYMCYKKRNKNEK